MLSNLRRRQDAGEELTEAQLKALRIQEEREALAGEPRRGGQEKDRPVETEPGSDEPQEEEIEEEKPLEEDVEVEVEEGVSGAPRSPSLSPSVPPTELLRAPAATNTEWCSTCVKNKRTKVYGVECTACGQYTCNPCLLQDTGKVVFCACAICGRAFCQDCQETCLYAGYEGDFLLRLQGGFLSNSISSPFR